MRYLFDDHVFDTERRELWRGDAALPVEPKVFDLLACLIANRHRVVSKEELLASVWEGRTVSESTLSSSINAARTAIGDTGEAQRLIRTLPRKGFRFVASVREEFAGAPDGETPVPPAEPVPRAPPAAAAPEQPRGPQPVSGVSLPERRPGGPRIALTTVVVAAGVLAVGAATLGYRLWFTPSGSPPVVSAPRFDAASVPLVDNETRRLLAGYSNRPDFKALAITIDGVDVADGEPNAEAAKQDALRRCNARTKRQCRIYAVGMEVVWPADAIPMPAPEDIRFEPIDAPLVTDDIPLVSRERRDAIARIHLPEANHRALALARGIAWTQGGRDSRAEAARLALERCALSAQRPCLLLSVDGMLTIRIPKSRKATRIFLPSVEADLPPDQRERIGRIYRGAEWRALARGKSGWHAVAAAPSEPAAVEAALNICSRSDSECRLYAIGNFRVAEP